jgi:hypothetical protein
MKAILILLLLAGSAVAQTPKLATVRIYTWYECARCIGAPDVPNGKGSGVYVSPNQILTAFHVVEGRKMGLPTPQGTTEHQNSVQVRFPDGHKCWATVEAEDAITDVALLRIAPHETITPLALGSDVVKNGIIKIHGYGWDFDYLTVRASVSNRMSPIEPLVVHPGGWAKGSVADPNGPWVNLFGAVARPGDSGGPLTKDGKVVGIVIKMGRGYSQGVGINHIKKLFTGRLK